jgi:hypothetical protein
MYETFRYRYLHAGVGLAANLCADAYETDGPPPPPPPPQKPPGLQRGRPPHLPLAVPAAAR